MAMRQRKYLSKLFVVLWISTAALFLAGLILLLLVNQGWKTYRGDSFSIKYPPFWFIQSLSTENSDLDMKTNEAEYLLSIDNVKQIISGEGYRTEGPEYVRIIVSRYLKENQPNETLELANEETSRLKTALQRKSARIGTYISGIWGIQDIITSSSADDPFDKQYSYWLETDNYIYHILGIVFIDEPVLQAYKYNVLLKLIVGSFRIE